MRYRDIVEADCAQRCCRARSVELNYHDFGCPESEAPYHRRRWIDFNHIEAVLIEWEDVDRCGGVKDETNLLKSYMEVTTAPLGGALQRHSRG